MARTTVWKADNDAAYMRAAVAHMSKTIFVPSDPDTIEAWRRLLLSDMFGYNTNSVFSTIDTLKAFVDSLQPLQRDALYEVLYHSGCRYRGGALEKWVKENK